MENINEETQEFLEKLPEVNTITAYGSGYFKQKDNEGKQLDLIVSVDNPNDWHKENYELNPEMYKKSAKKGLKNLIDNRIYRQINFPKSLGCFYTDFKKREFKLIVVDKRLLYDNLKTWNHLSLPGRFQKEMKVLVDNSDGVLPGLMKFNYESATKAALLMYPGHLLNVGEYYKNIASLSYSGDIRTIIPYEDPNKIDNIVEGSQDFFEENYGKSSEFYRKNDEIHKNENYENKQLYNIILTLPEGLKRYLLKHLQETDLEDPYLVAKIVKEFVFRRNLEDSILLALRCNQTVGKLKSKETRIEKHNKNKQKVKKSI